MGRLRNTSCVMGLDWFERCCIRCNGLDDGMWRLPGSGKEVNNARSHALSKAAS